MKEKEIIKIKEKKYIILTTTNYHNIHYAFANELDNNEEPTNTYFIFYETEKQDLVLLNDKSILDKLIPIFQKNLKETINKIIN